METPALLHPTDEILHAYGLGRLDDSAASLVQSHLEHCPDCRKRVASVSSDSFLGRLRSAEPRLPANGPGVSVTDGLSMLGTAPVEAAPPAADTIPPGLADHPGYEIVRELGRGGMGVVYLARNKLMGRLEVLKVVGGHLMTRPSVLERFLREIRLAALLHHPNIVTAYTALHLGESLVFRTIRNSRPITSPTTRSGNSTTPSTIAGSFCVCSTVMRRTTASGPAADRWVISSRQKPAPRSGRPRARRSRTICARIRRPTSGSKS